MEVSLWWNSERPFHQPAEKLKTSFLLRTERACYYVVAKVFFSTSLRSLVHHVLTFKTPMTFFVLLNKTEILFLFTMAVDFASSQASKGCTSVIKSHVIQSIFHSVFIIHHLCLGRLPFNNVKWMEKQQYSQYGNKGVNCVVCICFYMKERGKEQDLISFYQNPLLCPQNTYSEVIL